MQWFWGHVGLHQESRKSLRSGNMWSLIPCKQALRAHCMNPRGKALQWDLKVLEMPVLLDIPQEKLLSRAGARPREVSCALSGKVRGMELLQAIKFGRSYHQL